MQTRKINVMKVKKMKKEKVIVILSICLLLIVGFVGYSLYQNWQQNKMIDAFNQGYNQGITDTIIQVYQETDICEPIPLFVGDNTKHIIDVACLQQK